MTRSIEESGVVAVCGLNALGQARVGYNPPPAGGNLVVVDGYPAFRSDFVALSTCLLVRPWCCSKYIGLLSPRALSTSRGPQSLCCPDHVAANCQANELFQRLLRMASAGITTGVLPKPAHIHRRKVSHGCLLTPWVRRHQHDYVSPTGEVSCPPGRHGSHSNTQWCDSTNDYCSRCNSRRSPSRIDLDVTLTDETRSHPGPG